MATGELGCAQGVTWGRVPLRVEDAASSHGAFEARLPAHSEAELTAPPPAPFSLR